MKQIVFVLFSFCTLLCCGQANNKEYFAKYGIEIDLINQLSFKNEEAFRNFVKVFEEKQGFELPKFLIIDDSGKLLKHKLDVLISECGKGDVNNLKKKYFKKLPTVDQINEYFNEELKVPEENNFIVIFIWIEEMDKYNKHTFETYKIWKDNDNIEFHFLDMNFN